MIVLSAQLRDRGAAEECAQDAFVEAVRHWDTLQTYDDPTAWLWLVALRRGSKWRRRRSRAPVSTSTAAPAPELDVLIDLHDDDSRPAQEATRGRRPALLRRPECHRNRGATRHIGGNREVTTARRRDSRCEAINMNDQPLDDLDRARDTVNALATRRHRNRVECIRLGRRAGRFGSRAARHPTRSGPGFGRRAHRHDRVHRVVPAPRQLDRQDHTLQRSEHDADRLPRCLRCRFPAPGLPRSIWVDRRLPR